jgi:hypothetical protein
MHMTPRSLMTAIAATAVAFAIAIVVAASGAPAARLQQEPQVAAATAPASLRVDLAPHFTGYPGGSERMASWNASCTIAL